MAQVFSCKFCKNFRNNFFYRTPPGDCYCGLLRVLWVLRKILDMLFLIAPWCHIFVYLLFEVSPASLTFSVLNLNPYFTSICLWCSFLFFLFRMWFFDSLLFEDFQLKLSNFLYFFQIFSTFIPFVKETYLSTDQISEMETFRENN